MQIKFVLLVVFQVLALNEAYNFSCPPQAHWELRAKSMCIPPRNYNCLYNVTFRVNVYRDRCSRPRLLAAGYKYVFQPNLNRAACSFTRYQPFIFDTIGRSDCTFLKSFCNSEGQMTSTNGTTKSDRTCICNINEGYTFLTETNNQCSCNQSNEDCSCYIDTNHKNRTIGSKNSKCYGEITRNPSPSLRDTLNKSTIVKIKAFDNYKYNLVLPKEKYSTKAAIYILMLVLSYPLVTVGLYILQRILCNLISTPQNFDIVDCTNRSITVQWNINNQDGCLNFVLDHRPKGSADWKSLPLSTTDVFTGDNENRLYKLQTVFPETYYELRMCYVKNYFKGQYTESKTIQTLKSAPQNFDIVDCTDRSITVQWNINDQDGCLDYSLDHRSKGSAAWNSLSLTSTDVSVKNKGLCVYEVQILLPETSYELRICFMDRHGKGQYTGSKTLYTLKCAPQNLEIVECTDISIMVQWSIKNQDGCLNYILGHRPKGLADWKSLSLSTTDILAKYNGFRVYELQDLLPETSYEIRICFMDRHGKGQYTESKTHHTLKSAPKNFGIFDCTDRSITVQWRIKDQDGCLSYVLDYRSIWLADWKSLSFSTTDISAKEYGFRVYKLQNLLPETSYELRLCFMLSHVKGQYTESRTQQTLKAAPKCFDIEECTDRSITVKWNIDNLDDRLNYEIDHRCKGSANWTTFILSSTDVLTDEKGFCVYELHHLLPNTDYELRMCSVNNHVKGQHTESKTHQTLKTVLPEANTRLPEEDRIQYINLMKSSETEERHFVRILFVRDKSADKKSLWRRLLKENIDYVSSTDGIDIGVRRCKINIENGQWTIVKVRC